MSAQDVARNVAPRVGAATFWAFVGTVMVVGLALLGWQLRVVPSENFAMMGGALAIVAVMVVVGELRPLVIVGSGDAAGVTTSTAFTFALLLHMGLPIALLLQAGATLVADVVQRRAPWRTGFNIAQYSLSFGAASVVLSLFGRHASSMDMLKVSGHDLPAIAAAGLVYFVVNNALVTMAVSLLNHTSLRRELFSDLAYQAISTAALLGLAPIIVVIINRDSALLPLLVFPLGAVYGAASITLARERESLLDPLTGLRNRGGLMHSASRMMTEADESGRYVALFLLDLDRFKEINDTLGHWVGDALLRLVGQRLAGVLRPGDRIGRLGGDEFAVLVGELDDPADAVELGERFRETLAAPFVYDGLSHEIDGSVGVAVSPRHGDDFETLLQRADVAMYVAKENGTGLQLYSPDIDRHSTARLGLLAELRVALEHQELSLHYQPKADLRTGDVVGVEALLRWTHPERGMIAPDDFLPLAEQTGLMHDITRFVLDTALDQLAQWRRAGLRVQIAVNVSARDLYDAGFADRLAEAIRRYDVPPHALIIEVTESMLMTDATRAASTLGSLAGLGVGVSLDDFGTGYSSLMHLKRLPVSEVKIDRSFVMRMDVDDDDAAIVRSIIDLASALGMRTVAEGVENRDAWDRLASFGCDTAQGYFLARPMAAEVVTAWLEGTRAAPAGRGKRGALSVVPLLAHHAAGA